MLKSVIIDNREPRHIKSLSFGGVSTSIAQLEAGDIWAATGDDKLLVVERKTGSDLLKTIREQRLFPQAAKMIEVSPWAYLVITGDFSRSADGKVRIDRATTGWSWSAVQGALLTVQEMGVGVVYSDDFEQAVIRLGKRDRSEVRIGPPRAAIILSDGEALLGALPGIGEERVNALLQYTGTPAWALVYLTEIGATDGAVSGIGDVTKAKVRRALGLRHNEQMSIQLEEGSNDK